MTLIIGLFLCLYLFVRHKAWTRITTSIRFGVAQKYIQIDAIAHAQSSMQNASNGKFFSFSGTIEFVKVFFSCDFFLNDFYLRIKEWIAYFVCEGVTYRQFADFLLRGAGEIVNRSARK